MAGAVIATLLYVVAVATPSIGVTIVALVTRTTFPVPDEERAVTALVPDPNKIPVSVEAPVPPPETVRAVVSPVMDVMSLLAPEAARLATKLALVIFLLVLSVASMILRVSPAATVDTSDNADTFTWSANLF